jgi:CRP/FNR family cyclic AMP-dependent transcriptional regulator
MTLSTLIAFRDFDLKPSQNPDRSMRFRSDLSPEAISDFDSLGKLSSLPRACVIFKEDNLCREVIFLLSGEVKLFSTSSRGRTLILKIARSGDLLGLTAAICGSRYEMSAETVVPTFVRTIPSSEFLHFIERHRGVQMQMARLLAEDCKSAFLDVRKLAYSSASERIATILVNWERTTLTPEPRRSFDMTLTHDELGSLAGVTRETVSRVLSEFQKKKLIAIHGTSFLILEPARLASLIA